MIKKGKKKGSGKIGKMIYLNYDVLIDLRYQAILLFFFLEIGCIMFLSINMFLFLRIYGGKYIITTSFVIVVQNS